MKLCMFRTVPLSIISNYSLYTQHWYQDQDGTAVPSWSCCSSKAVCMRKISASSWCYYKEICHDARSHERHDARSHERKMRKRYSECMSIITVSSDGLLPVTSLIVTLNCPFIPSVLFLSFGSDTCFLPYTNIIPIFHFCIPANAKINEISLRVWHLGTRYIVYARSLTCFKKFGEVRPGILYS
jgi:hypothetical protein